MKTLRSVFPLFLAALCVANALAATGPSVAITSPASSFSTTVANITVQGTSSGVSALVASVKVDFVAATSTNNFTNWLVTVALGFGSSAKPRQPMK